jgi:uncharacterized protein DUF6713
MRAPVGIKAGPVTVALSNRMHRSSFQDGPLNGERVKELLFWIYLCNAVVLIMHEIDSAYWKEWELFRLPGGIAGFLLLHAPLLLVLLYGLVMVREQSFPGLLFSLALGLGGVFAFSIHLFFIARGRHEFRTPVSLSILSVMLVVSILQLIVTIPLLP